MPRLGPEEDHAFQENARVVTCAVKTNRICWSVHALDCCRTFKRDFQAKVKAKQARWLTIPGRMLELVSWLKNSCFIFGWPMFRPCFGEDFQLGRTLLCSTGGPDGVGWQAEHCRAGSGKGPASHVCFKKEMARWLKDVLPIGQKSVEDSVRTHITNLTLLKMWGGNDGHCCRKWANEWGAVWSVVCGEGRLEFVEALGVKVVKAVKAVSGPGGDHCLPKSGWTCLYLRDGLATRKKISLRPTGLVMHDPLVN